MFLCYYGKAGQENWWPSETQEEFQGRDQSSRLPSISQNPIISKRGKCTWFNYISKLNNSSRLPWCGKDCEMHLKKNLSVTFTNFLLPPLKSPKNRLFWFERIWAILATSLICILILYLTPFQPYELPFPRVFLPDGALCWLRFVNYLVYKIFKYSLFARSPTGPKINHNMTTHP